METIKKNNKKFFRFKIGDEFKHVSGKGSFNKMKKEGLCSDVYNDNDGYIYPFYDGSTLNNHIKGYSLKSNFEGMALKVAKDGAGAGSTILIQGKTYNADHSYYLTSNSFTNEYMALFMNTFLKGYQQGTSIPSVKFSDYSEEVVEIPINHQALSRIIKRILNYKQLSERLNKKLKDYKRSILQESEKQIEYFKKTNKNDGYISLKIGHEFKSNSGKGSFNKMKKEGLCSDVYNKEEGYIYPVYDASQSNNHLKGWSKIKNVKGPFIKVSKTGNSLYKGMKFDKTPAGSSVFVNGDAYICDASLSLKSEKFNNEFMGLFMNKFIPKHEQGTNGLHNVYFSSIENKVIEIPKNHKDLSKIIKKINDWQKMINEAIDRMENYIDGVLQLSLGKGNKDE